jgi:multicomponent K+:H+ antiporter subunit F
MENALTITIWVVLVIHLLMALAAVWKVLRGENPAARLAGLDLFSTLTIAILIIIAIVSDSSLYIDLAAAAAALGYLTTIVLAKYISDQKVF